MAWFLELPVVTDTAGTTRVLRASTAAQFMTLPTDTPANTVFEGRLLEPGNLQRFAWSQSSTSGRSTIGFGPITLDNSDQSLRWLLNSGPDGQRLTLRNGPTEDSMGRQLAFPGNQPVFASGTVDHVEFVNAKATLSQRTSQSDFFGLTLQPTKYLGNNVLPNGLEGVATDIGGKPKPVLSGNCVNIPAPCVNTSILIYQVHDRGGVTVTAVRDKAANLSGGTVQRTSLAALLANTPAAGGWDWYSGPEGTYVRLGSTPTARITVDAQEGATAADRTIAQCVSRSVTTYSTNPIGPGLIDGIGNMDAACPGEVGNWQGTDETTLINFIAPLLDSACATFVDSRSGRFFIGVLMEPERSGALVIQEWMIKGDISLVTINAPQDQDSGLPVASTTITYDKVFQVQNEVELAGVALPTVNYYKNETRSFTTTPDAGVLTKHKKAGLFPIKSLFRSLGDATTGATRIALRQQALRGTDRYIVGIPVDPSVAVQLDLLNSFVLQVDLNRNGGSPAFPAMFDWGGNGKTFRVIGFVEDYGAADRAEITTIYGWG